MPICVRHCLILTGVVAAPGLAASGAVSVAIPRLKVAEYHDPYVAAWVETPGQPGIRTLAVWYDVRPNQREPGTKWLSDLRAWWRKGGRSMKMPADGVSGATKGPGVHRIALPANLPAGNHLLQVEAARELGGREIVSIPFQWPPKAAAAPAASGKSELGAVTLTLRP